jgi:hypothetical protein
MRVLPKLVHKFWEHGAGRTVSVSQKAKVRKVFSKAFKIQICGCNFLFTYRRKLERRCYFAFIFNQQRISFLVAF